MGRPRPPRHAPAEPGPRPAPRPQQPCPAAGDAHETHASMRGGTCREQCTRRRRAAKQPDGAGRPAAAPAGPSASPILQQAGCPGAFRGGGRGGGGLWLVKCPTPPPTPSHKSEPAAAGRCGIRGSSLRLGNTQQHRLGGSVRDMPPCIVPPALIRALGRTVVVLYA